MTANKTAVERGAAWRAPGLALKIVAAVLGVLLAAWLILYVTKGRFLKEPFLEIAARTSGRDVSIGGDFQLYFDPLHIKFLARDVAVANPAWARDRQLFEAERIDLELNLWQLIAGKRRFNHLRLAKADIALERDGKGQNTWTFNTRRDAPLELPVITRAAITGTTVSYVDPSIALETFLRIGNVAARDTRVEKAIPFTGHGRSHGTPFTVSGRLTAPNATIAGGRNELALRIDVGDSRIDAAGTLPGATQLEGSDLAVSARGQSLQTAFRLIGVVVPETRRYQLAAKFTKAGGEYRFTRLRGSFGNSDLAGRMTISRRSERLLITADLASRKLDILDAGPWIGYHPERLDRFGGKGVIESEGGQPRLLPDAALASDSLGNFDAEVRYRARTVDTGTVDIRGLDIALALDRKMLRLSPVAFDIAGGRLTADIGINARRTPVVTDYDVRLSPVRLRHLLAAFDIDSSGTTGTLRGRLQLRGYGDTVRDSLGSSSGRVAIILPRGTLWLQNAELAELDVADFLEAAISKKLKKPAMIRCGLLGFTVRNGIASADPIFIDTERSVIRGKGIVSLRNEALDLSLEADSKNISLFSGQSPIGIKGYFATPRIDPISKELLTRGAAGAALGILVTPLAAIAAFLDLGEEEDTNCTPVLAGARSATIKAADKAAETAEGKKGKTEKADKQTDR